MVEGNTSFGERLEHINFTDYLKEAKKFVNVSDIER